MNNSTSAKSELAVNTSIQVLKHKGIFFPHEVSGCGISYAIAAPLCSVVGCYVVGCVVLFCCVLVLKTALKCWNEVYCGVSFY